MHFNCNFHRIHGTNGIFTYVWLKSMVNVGKYAIHRSTSTTASGSLRSLTTAYGKLNTFFFHGAVSLNGLCKMRVCHLFQNNQTSQLSGNMMLDHHDPLIIP